MIFQALGLSPLYLIHNFIQMYFPGQMQCTGKPDQKLEEFLIILNVNQLYGPLLPMLTMHFLFMLGGHYVHTKCILCAPNLKATLYG